MITSQEIMDRAFQLEITKIHFERILWPNYRLLDSNEMEIAEIITNLIDQEIIWLRPRDGTMIADQAIRDRISQFGMEKRRFQELLVPNDRVRDSNEIEIAEIVFDFINREINWLRNNLS